MAAVPFTPQELEMSANDALRNEDLRVRILQHVAAVRGISTRAALKLVEHTAGFELQSTTPLGQVLSHMDHPNFNLDTDLRAVFANSRLLNRIVEAISEDQSIDFMNALEQLHRGVDSIDYAPYTLRSALKGTNTPPEEVAESLRLLEKRDEVVQRTLDQALAADPQTKRLLDQGAGGSAAAAGTDIGAALADPVERERRLARARKVSSSYAGDEGRKMFFDHDRANLEVGKDNLVVLEANAARRAAEAKAARVGAQLDQAIKAAAGKRGRMRALEAEIAKLNGERAKLAGSAAAPARDAQKLMLLDADSPESRNTLVSTVLQIRAIDLRKARPELTFEECSRRVLEAAEPGCPLTQAEEAEQWRRGVYYALDQGQEPEPAPAPANPSAEMHQRVVERMRQLDRPESEYFLTATELMAEDAGKPRRFTLEGAVLSRPPSPSARKILEEVNAQAPKDLNDGMRLLAQHPAEASDAWREAFVLLSELKD